MIDITLTREPGLHHLPDDRVWRRWMFYLTPVQRRVYRYLLWKATAPGVDGARGPKKTNSRMLARGIGNELEGWKWEGKGQMSQAAFLAVVRELGEKGLLDVTDDPAAEW